MSTQTVSQNSSTPPAATSEIQLAEGPFTLWAVYKRSSDLTAGRQQVISASGFEQVIAKLPKGEVAFRGLYDVSGMRADADLMVWIHGSSAEVLQATLRKLRRTDLLRHTELVWSVMGVHRDAEFSANHYPSFYRGVPPAQWLCLYPFVRSHEWYLLPEAERGAMLREHGGKGRDYAQVLPNTVASFALNDYEWLLGLEAENLVDLVDLMRHLRKTEARRHVREETPFYTGRRITPEEAIEVLQ